MLNICMSAARCWFSESSEPAHNFPDLVLSQKDKLLNPHLSCRSLCYTTRKSLRQSRQVKLHSAGPYDDTLRVLSFSFLAHCWHRSAACDSLSIRKTKQCKWMEVCRNGKCNPLKLLFIDVTAEFSEVHKKELFLNICINHKEESINYKPVSALLLPM